MSKLGSGISLLVPFRDDHTEGRLKNWLWLKAFWEHELPGAEMIIGIDTGSPFSKTCAMNNAFQHSHGDILILLDADCYIEPNVILQCADRIRKARDEQEPLWFVPYRHLFRLTLKATEKLVASNPKDALRFSIPPDPNDIGNAISSGNGHWFGALIQIMPREAYLKVGGMDPRFRGWGGEDITLVRVVDTLYGRHRTTNDQVFTLMHHVNGNALLRMWEGQNKTGINNRLSVHYRETYGDKVRMCKVIQEWRSDIKYREHLIENDHEGIESCLNLDF